MKGPGVLLALVVATGLTSGCTAVVGDGSYAVREQSAQSACAAPAGASACHQCLDAQCCAPSSACSADADCSELLSCETSCGDSACVSQCQSTYPGGISLLQAVLSCSSASCPVCGQAGVGDACSSSDDNCGPGLTCTGVFCTKSCAGDSDCTGAYDDGKNQSGTVNVCAMNAQNAAICFPGCSSNADCTLLSGTSCQSDARSTSGNALVCATSS